MDTDPARAQPPEDGLLESINTHTRDIRAYAWSLVGATVVLSCGLAILTSLPCLWPPPSAADAWPQCAGAALLDFLRMDPAPVRDMVFWLGALFVAMLLAVVLMRPSASSSSAQREALRGVLVAWSQALGLLSAMFTVWWAAMTGVQVVEGWLRQVLPAHLGTTSHPLELLAGFVLLLFFASTTALLQPGLGLTTRNIRWAQQSLQRIDDWESQRLPRLMARADMGTAASHLFLVIVVTATHSRWDLDALNPSGPEFLTVACVIAVLWLVLVGACNGFHGVDNRLNRWLAAVLGTYMAVVLALVLAYLLPIWAAILWSAAWFWATTATVSAIALSQYRSPSRWRFSLQASNNRNRRRYQKAIEENVKILQRATG